MIRLLKDTVFEPIADDWKPDKVLAVLFHRSAATLYLIYFLWGITSIVWSLPSIVEAQGSPLQIFFSTLVSIVSFLAFLGALHFPNRARLELYSAATFAVLVLVYEGFLTWAFITGKHSYGPTLVLTTSYFVVALSRVVFIYRTFVKQAEVTNEPGGH